MNNFWILLKKKKPLQRKKNVNFTLELSCILWLNNCNASSQKEQTQNISCLHGYRLLVPPSELYRIKSLNIYILVFYSVGGIQSNLCLQWYVRIGWSILWLSFKKKPNTHIKIKQISGSLIYNTWNGNTSLIVLFFLISIIWDENDIFKIQFLTQDQRP